jgi:hypothetical protein
MGNTTPITATRTTTKQDARAARARGWRDGFAGRPLGSEGLELHKLGCSYRCGYLCGMDSRLDGLAYWPAQQLEQSA